MANIPTVYPTIQYFENNYCVSASVLDVTETMHLEIPKKVKSVTVENLLDLESYHITNAFGSTSHHFKFIDGGEVKLSYTHKGCAS